MIGIGLIKKKVIIEFSVLINIYKISEKEARMMS